MTDAHRRSQLGQLKYGEDVKESGGKVQVSGQVAVMQINGLLTKVIFDKNPENEFFVEESFPPRLDVSLFIPFWGHYEDQSAAIAGDHRGTGEQGP